MNCITRSHANVYLLGSIKETLAGAKLPSIGDVMGVYLHKLQTCAETKHDAALQTIIEVEEFWNRARIPVRPRHHAVKQLEKTMTRWENLKKSKGRQSTTQTANEDALKQTFADLFDIAHEDALLLIKIEEDRQFLLAQREKGRIGSMAGVDTSLARKEKKATAKQEKRLQFERKQKEECNSSQLKAAISSSETESNDEDTSDSISGTGNGSQTPRKCKRGRRTVLTPEVLSSLDRTKTSIRSAVHNLSAAVQASAGDLAEFNINRSSIHRARLMHRSLTTAHVKENFDPKKPLVLHFDGKILKDVTGEQNVDRLAIIVSGSGTEQLLAIPKLSNGTGKEIANALVESVTSWGLQERIKGLSFDTTASNTGLKSGACVLFQSMLQCDVLHLACRHHIHEIMLEEVFLQSMGPSSGPNITLFQRFQSFWPNIEVNSYKSGIADQSVHMALQGDIAEMIQFATNQLQNVQPRDDYMELLELVIIFLGGVPPRGVHFLKPGALHRARFMAKLLYSYKIFLFRDTNFKLTERERKGLAEVCLFGVQAYVKSWMLCSVPSMAPSNDLQLLKKLAILNSIASKCALNKFLGHLWYLSEDLVALALFDREVCVEEKKRMVNELQKKAKPNPKKRITVKKECIPDLQLHNFVTSNSLKIFKLLSLSEAFLEADPITWIIREDYLYGEEIVRQLRVTNDTAERGIAMIQEFSGLLTKDEEQTQFALQVVREHRKKFPKCSKNTILQNMPK
jgi:hypothetical protein